MLHLESSGGGSYMAIKELRGCRWWRLGKGFDDGKDVKVVGIWVGDIMKLVAIKYYRDMPG